MPLVTWAVVSYAVGLFATFVFGPVTAVACGTLCAMLAAIMDRGRGTRAAVLSLVYAAAVLAACAAERRDGLCARSLLAARSWTADAEAALSAGDAAHLDLGSGNCRVHATVLLAAGAVRSGRHVLITGNASLSTRGLLVADARVQDDGDAVAFARLRSRTAKRIDRLFVSDAPMVRALVIGDMSGIPADERDAFARAGLVHMLSVSGLHVGIIALLLELLAQVLRLPRAPARVSAMAVLALYVVAIGAPAPAVRAAVMLGVLLLSRLMQRPVSAWAVFALGAGAPLVDPRLVLDLGWQLSVAGTAALIAGGLLAQRVMPHGWRGWRRSLATGAVVSVVATIVTAPLVAWVFGRIAVLGPLTNLIADPVMGLLQPVLFLVLALPVRLAERTGADAAHVLLAVFARVAHLAAAIPMSAPPVSMSTLGAVAAGSASVAIIVACCAEDPIRWVIVACGALVVAYVEPMVPHPGSAELHMLDVGQGDAFAIRTSRGRWIVVDAGREWDGGDAGRATLAPLLARHGGELALFVLSHPHADHAGGAASLFALHHPGRFADPGYPGTTPSYQRALAEIAREGVPWSRVHPGDSLVIDDVTLSMLAPDSTWVAGLQDANLASTVMLARIGHMRVLFTGDAEAEEERWLLDRYAGTQALRADVLKVGHHGSRTSTTPAFLTAVRPRLALVSVGAHNAYGHPDAEVMDALLAAHVPALRTDRLGTVLVRAVGSEVEVDAQAQRWIVPRR